MTVLLILGRRGAWYALIIVATSTTFTHYITDGKVDLFAAALGLGAFYWALRTAPGAEHPRALGLAGSLAGFATVARFPYLAAFLPAVYFPVTCRQRAAGGSPEHVIAVLARKPHASSVGCCLAVPIGVRSGRYGAPLTELNGI